MPAPMNIEDRLQAITMNLQLAERDIEAVRAAVRDLKTLARQDGENIRALARIVEIHARRLSGLEDQG